MKNKCALLVVLMLTSHAHAAYVLTDLGEFSANGINSLGQIVGTASNGGITGGAFIWSASTGIQPLSGIPQGTALKINDLGQVVGSGSSTSGHAYLWEASSGARDLGTINNGFGEESLAYDLNNHGQVVGWSEVPFLDGGAWSYTEHAFIWSAATGVQDLGDLSGGINKSRAYATNNTGQVVGYGYAQPSNYADSGMRAFSWTASGGMIALPIGEGQATGINDLGQIVGQYRSNDTWRGFVLDASMNMTDLGDLPGGIDYNGMFAINNVGQAVGFSESDLGTRAAIWENGELTDLSLLPEVASTGWVLEGANDINDAGQIVGWGKVNGQNHGYLLTPVTSVPEPNAFLLFVTGLGTLLCTVYLRLRGKIDQPLSLHRIELSTPPRAMPTYRTYSLGGDPFNDRIEFFLTHDSTAGGFGDPVPDGEVREVTPPLTEEEIRAAFGCIEKKS